MDKSIGRGRASKIKEAKGKKRRRHAQKAGPTKVFGGRPRLGKIGRPPKRASGTTSLDFTASSDFDPQKKQHNCAGIAQKRESNHIIIMASRGSACLVEAMAALRVSQVCLDSPSTEQNPLITVRPHAASIANMECVNCSREPSQRHLRDQWPPKPRPNPPHSTTLPDRGTLVRPAFVSMRNVA